MIHSNEGLGKVEKNVNREFIIFNSVGDFVLDTLQGHVGRTPLLETVLRWEEYVLFCDVIII